MTPEHDWAQHGLPAPPKGSDEATVWMQNVLWIMFGMLREMRANGCQLHGEMHYKLRALENSNKGQGQALSAWDRRWQQWSGALKLCTYVSGIVFFIMATLRVLDLLG